MDLNYGNRDRIADVQSSTALQQSSDYWQTFVVSTFPPFDMNAFDVSIDLIDHTN
jgi:hypothetical protein